MTTADRYLIKHGFNLDGSKRKKGKAFKDKKKNLRIESLIASKKDMIGLKYKRWAIEDR